MNTTKATLQFFWKYTRHYKKQLALSFLIVFPVVINAVTTPLLASYAIAKIGDSQATSLSFTAILLLIAVSSIIGVILNRIATIAVNDFELRAGGDLINDTASHLLNESYDFHTKSFSGALISQTTRLLSGYILFMDTFFLSLIRSTFIVIASCIAILFYDVKLALIMIVITTVSILATIYLARKRYPLQKKSAASMSKHTAYLSDMISNALTVKTFAREQYELKEFSKATNEYIKSTKRAWKLQVTAGNMIMVMATIMYMVVLAYGIYTTQNGLLPVAVFIAAQLYAVRINGVFWDVSAIVRNFERAFADAHEMVQIRLKESEIPDQDKAQELRVTKGQLSLRNVVFRYKDAPDQANVINGLSIDIKAGEKFGFVGKSGGGKTTITKLILRFMDIQQGSINIDNQNIAEVTQASLRNSIAYVPQEPLLFHRSIADNIRYGNPEASDKQVKHAAKLAYADEFIDKLPEGYDTEVGERGVKLSGGQRQRIAIARALLRDSKILVLDEATSALDSESEKLIQEALWKLMKNRTSIVIAHRLSTIQRMDRIAVIDNGKIIEIGTHTELLKKNGQYAKLWAHQSGGFLES